jgi:hypothetical protein
MEISSQQLFISAELLGLSDIEVLEVKVNAENEIIIKVKSTKEEITCHRFVTRVLIIISPHSPQVFAISAFLKNHAASPMILALGRLAVLL